MKCSVNLVKNVSSMRMYSFLREVGVSIPTLDGTHRVMKGGELDKFVKEQIWKAAHPGMSPKKEFHYGVSKE